MSTAPRKITWAMLESAGVDCSLIQRSVSAMTDRWEGGYTITFGDERLAVGPAEDPEGVCEPGEHPGWAWSYLERDGDRWVYQGFDEWADPNDLEAVYTAIHKFLDGE
jgi:hypothetical protein